ncbi:MAG: class I SAM-dependent methyltransferase [Terracidiphilus sp.]
MTSTIENLIEELESDPSLDEPDRLRQRIEALDLLEAWLMPDESARLIDPRISQRVKAICERLEAVNLRLYQAIRGKIQRGAGRNILLPYLSEHGSDRASGGLVNEEGYDYLDELIGGVLQLQEPGVEAAHLEKEMVPYQPTPARHIFDMFSRAGLTEEDVLVDLGSGLGHVPLLTSICTNARCIGIELEAAYVDCARRCAQELNLPNVAFIVQDVRAANLSDGTVFYLYTPFTGAILHEILESLRREAMRRKIRICTLGPCTPTVAAEPWLEAHGAAEMNRIAVFSSRC